MERDIRIKREDQMAVRGNTYWLGLGVGVSVNLRWRRPVAWLGHAREESVAGIDPYCDIKT